MCKLYVTSHDQFTRGIDQTWHRSIVFPCRGATSGATSGARAMCVARIYNNCCWDPIGSSKLAIEANMEMKFIISSYSGLNYGLNYGYPVIV